MAKPRHLLCLLPLLPTLSQPVLGQSEEPTVQRVDREQLVLEEVLVTANRRVESLQEVPMSVSAFSVLSVAPKGFE